MYITNCTLFFPPVSTYLCPFPPISHFLLMPERKKVFVSFSDYFSFKWNLSWNFPIFFLSTTTLKKLKVHSDIHCAFPKTNTFNTFNTIDHPDILRQNHGKNHHFNLHHRPCACVAAYWRGYIYINVLCSLFTLFSEPTNLTRQTMTTAKTPLK